MIQQKRNQLLEVYRKWGEELKRCCPQPEDKQFSHPYFLYIPDNWYNSQFRILIVGEEGHGKKAFDESIENAQSFNRDYMDAQLTGGKSKNKSPFWNRIRKIDALFVGGSHSITWTNLDMIHYSGEKKCKLSTSHRKALHSTHTRILEEEISILQPTHVIYFGWYGVSLKAELPEVYKKLYPGGAKDNSMWKPDNFCKFDDNNIWHIFTYHPGWGQRQKNGYEDSVLEVIKGTIQQTQMPR